MIDPLEIILLVCLSLTALGVLILVGLVLYELIKNKRNPFNG